MPTIINEQKYLREDVAKFDCAVIEASGKVYTTDQLENLIKEFNRETDILINADSMDRDKLEEGGRTGAYKSKNGLNANYFVFLFAIGDEMEYPVPLFHSYANQYSMVFNELLIGKSIGKLGIFVAWLAAKDAWECLKLSYCATEPQTTTVSSVANKQYYEPNDCPAFSGCLYERGSWAPGNVTLTCSNVQIEFTLKDYIQSDPALKQMLIQAGGIQQGAHLIPDYITNQRLSGAISSKTFRDIATQLNMVLSAYGVQNPNFDGLCKLMGIEE